MNDESQLLLMAVLFKNGHPRRTQHILKVYSLSKLIGEHENLSPEKQQLLCAAAILHDIAIKLCKEKYGDACQENQQIEAPSLVKHFLNTCNYLPSYRNTILNLVLNHHNYNIDQGIEHQILIEADLLVNCFEDESIQKKALEVYPYFKTKIGIQILEKLMKNE
ncbi:HD domain-containing protein [Clostridiisalibacter paucivorans]|uniref:HD domain-containing protein n=1 Tax=Clostridiisalibacter paucivorans TaxID=408753 RepID=UPI00146FC2F0|nr:HD domain-containing protein [Clostridiisalibacter paucivorans]